MKRILIWLAAIFMLIVITGIVFVLIKTRDRHPGYEVDLRLPFQTGKSGQLQVGFATETITPSLNLIRAILILTETGMANSMHIGLLVLITGALPMASTMISGLVR